MDRGTWRAAVHRVASWPTTERLSTHAVTGTAFDAITLRCSSSQPSFMQLPQNEREEPERLHHLPRSGLAGTLSVFSFSLELFRSYSSPAPGYQLRRKQIISDWSPGTQSTKISLNQLSSFSEKQTESKEIMPSLKSPESAVSFFRERLN